MGANDRFVQVEDGAALSMKAIAAALRPPPPLTVTEWADAHRRLPSKGASEPGQWRTARVPFLAEIMDCLSDSHPSKRVVFVKSAQVGGPLALDTPIPTITGWTTMGDILVGDRVFDESGAPCTVLSVSEVFRGRDCYRITFCDGEQFVCDASHRWPVVEYRSGAEVGARTVTTDEIAERWKDGQRSRFGIRVCQPLDTAPAALPIHPYALGQWLANGNSNANQLTVHESDAAEVAAHMTAAGHPSIARKMAWDKGRAANILIEPRSTVDGTCIRGHHLATVGTYQRTKRGVPVEVCAECARQHSMKHQYGRAMDPIVRGASFGVRLDSLDLRGNKHIPPTYLRASRAQRLALLQGLMDGDGSIDKRGRAEITTSSKALYEQIYELLISLGLKPSRSERPARGFSGAAMAGTHYRLSFVAYSDTPVFKLPRKLVRQRPRDSGRPSEVGVRRIRRVEPVPSVPVRCIEVSSPSHLYLAGRAMVPTHNTECGLNWVGWHIGTRMAPMLCVQPTLDMAERWSKQRLAPMIEDTPHLRSKIAPARQRDSGNTTLLKEYPGGVVIVAGANSASGLRSMPAARIFLDEVDAYPIELEGEGDPIKLAEARASTFSRRKIFLVSTPTIESLSRIWKEWRASDQRRYHVACPHCSHEQTLEWENLGWPEGRPLEAVYHCAGCGVGIEERYKTEMLAAGRWIAEHPERTVPGFHVNALYTPVGLGLSWGELAEESETAKRDKSAWKTFENTKLGRVSKDPTEKLDEDELKARATRYDLRSLPPGCVLLTCAVDVQKDRLALLVLGWGTNGRWWIIDHLERQGDPTEPEVWEWLDQYVASPFKNSRGFDVRIRMTAVDSGFLQDTVIDFTAPRQRRGVMATKGASTRGRPIIQKPSRIEYTPRGKQKKYGAEQWQVGTDTAKTHLFHVLDGDRDKTAMDRRVAFSDQLGEAFYSQLTAEIYDPNRRKWVKVRDRNEVLDLFCLNIAAGYRNDVLGSRLRERELERLQAQLEPEMDLFSAPPASTSEPPRPAAPSSDTPPTTPMAALLARRQAAANPTPESSSWL